MNTKMSAIPDVVPDPTDPGTVQPNIEPEPTTGDHFEPLFCSDFEHQINLPPGVDRNDPFSIWSLSFTVNIMQLIVHCTNQRASRRKSVPNVTNCPARTQLPSSSTRQKRWFELAKKTGPVGLGTVPAALGGNKTAATVPFLLDLLPKVPSFQYVVWL
jgi:hypothetical protein